MVSVGQAMVLSSFTLVFIVYWLSFKYPAKRHSQKWANATAICAIASLPLWLFTAFTKIEAEIISGVTNLVGEQYSEAALFIGFYFAVLIIAGLIAVTIWKCAYRIAEIYESKAET